MPFEMTNAPTTFMELMHRVLICKKMQLVYRNQQNLYPRVPTTVAELLQYNGLGSNMRMGFLRERRVAVD